MGWHGGCFKGGLSSGRLTTFESRVPEEGRCWGGRGKMIVATQRRKDNTRRDEKTTKSGETAATIFPP